MRKELTNLNIIVESILSHRIEV